MIISCKVCKHEFRNPQTKGVSSNHEYCFSRKQDLPQYYLGTVDCVVCPSSIGGF